MFRKQIDQAEAGDNLGILLRGVKKDDVKRGMVISKPRSIKAHRKVQAQVRKQNLLCKPGIKMTILELIESDFFFFKLWWWWWGVLVFQVYVLTKDEGGMSTPFTCNSIPHMFSLTWSVTCALTLPGDKVCLWLNPCTCKVQGPECTACLQNEDILVSPQSCPVAVVQFDTYFDLV